MSSTSIIITLGLLFIVRSQNTMTYLNVLLGSVKWPFFISLCGGEHQSPINIDPLLAVVVKYPRLVFGNYNKVFPETVMNNGHTGKS